jgi:hypothetical protein
MQSTFRRRLLMSFAWAGMAALASVTLAQDSGSDGANFPGVKQALTPEQYAAAGLGKLSPDEQAKLDQYLRAYFSGATQQVVKAAVAQASATAVDQAVKENKVEPPQLIESKILGTVDGWPARGKTFTLENGQRWKTTDNENRYFPPVTDPEVFLVKDFFGYKMAIAGGGVTRVIRVK